MTYFKTTHRRRGAVLIAVIGILAVLSLMAAVFGMLMSMERAAGRNQNEHEMARGAAQAAYEYVSQYLRSIPVATLSSSGAPVICPEPYNEFFSKELFRTDGVKVGFITAEPSESPYYHANLMGKSWTTGLGTANAGMFDLNGMGHLADLGTAPDKNQRYSSLETSLTRLLKARFDTMALDTMADPNKTDIRNANTGTDDDIWDFYNTAPDNFDDSSCRLRLAQLLATAIIAHRYGEDHLPGTAEIEEHFPEHLPLSLFWPDYYLTSVGGDAGTPLHGDYWGIVGKDSLATDPLVNYCISEGYVSAATLSSLTTVAAWKTDQYAGLVVAIDSGTGAGQWRDIVSNTATTLTIVPNWGTTPDATSTFVIQHRQMSQLLTSGFWNGEDVFLMVNDFNATPANKGETVAITSNDIFSLTTANWSASLQRGDYFCINRAGGGANQKIGGSDSVPTALLWPNGALSCERDVFPRAAHTGVVVDIPAAGNQIRIDKSGLSVVGKVIRILDGTGRGQVRRITGVASDLLTLSAAWRVTPAPTDQRYPETGTGTISGYNAGLPTIDVGGTPWQPGEHTGLVVRITSGDAEGERRRIISNSENVLTLASAFPVTIPPSPANGDSFIIVSQTYAIEQDYFDAGTTSAAAAIGTNTLVDSDKGYNWTDDAYIGGVVHTGGQTRLITDNDANTLTLARNWRANVLINDPFRIEIPQDHKYHPDDLRGDDRVYRSVPEILPVMVDALMDEGLTSASAGKVAAILYEGHPDLATPVVGFSKDLTVSGASALDKTEYASINDTANDGIDNDNDGLIDEDDEANWSADEQANYLFDKLGLREWAGDRDAEILQAAQIVANIMDSRDEDDVPTILSKFGTAGVDEKILTATVYGYEGVHVTEVMATPPKVYSTLTDLTAASELVDDGGTGGIDIPAVPPPNTGDDDNDDDIMQGTYGLPVGYILNQRPDLDGWDWNNTGGYWEVVDPTGVGNRITGEWEFTQYEDRNIPGTYHNLVNGWYAIRIRANDGNTPSGGVNVKFTNNGVDYNVTTVKNATTGECWGYVRAADNRLAAVQVATQKLGFKIEAGQYTRFYGFQLLPQYIEITNCAAHDVILNAVTFNNTLGATKTMNLGRGAVLPGAAADGNYPIRYGNFILAMSEAAYERQWNLTSANGVWGDDPQENYPVFFVGDLGDDDADSMLLAYANPTITVRSKAKTIASAGPIAGNPLDGSIGTCTDYVAREKTDTPFKRTWADYAGTEVGTALAGSQNKPAGSGCLNEQYSTIWDGVVGYPTLYSEANFKTNNPDSVWPLILNRPFPSPGWLGLVLTGHDDWRTIDPESTTDGNDTVDDAEELLGTLMSHALVGGVHARINLNHPVADTRAHVLETVFSGDVTAGDVKTIEDARLALADGWTNWDHLLNTVAVQGIANRANAEDSGAGTFADDYEDDPDEKEEWARRYSNVVDLKASNFKYVLAGVVYAHDAKAGDRPLAVVRIEVDFAIDGTELKVVNFRYVME